MSDVRKEVIRYELQKEIQKAKALEKEDRMSEASRHYLKASALYRRLAKGMPLKQSGEAFSTAAQYETIASHVQSGSKEMSDQAIEALIVTHQPSTRWEDIGGLEEAKKTIKEAIVLPFIRHKPEFVKSPKTILLYGPPGTGKTMLAKASSHNIGATFFEARISSLLSKYFGESSKLVNALFAKARESQPSMIFMDELDSIAISRSSDMHESTRRVLSQLLTEIEGFNTKTDDRILVTGATNKPWDLDDAVVSRFQKRIYVPLPDAKAREQILKIHLKGADFSGVDMKNIVERTERFSGRDLSGLCQEAVMHMIREKNPKLESLSSRDIEGYSLGHRPLEERDFEAAFHRIRPGVGKADLEKYESWKGEYGG